MTKEKFIAMSKKRGYEVEELGRMVILRHENYTAFHFFNEDGTPDKDNPPCWTVD